MPIPISSTSHPSPAAGIPAAAALSAPPRPRTRRDPGIFRNPPSGNDLPLLLVAHCSPTTFPSHPRLSPGKILRSGLGKSRTKIGAPQCPLFLGTVTSTRAIQKGPRHSSGFCFHVRISQGTHTPAKPETIGPSPGRQPTQECTSGSRPLVPDFGGNGHSHCRLGERSAGRVPPCRLIPLAGNLSCYPDLRV